MEPIVSFHSVELTYNSHLPVFQNVSFNLKAGSFHFLLGASGAGKTSLLRLIYLDAFPSQGSIQLLGRDVKSLKKKDIPSLRQQMGIIFQEFCLLNHLSVLDNVALPLRISGISDQRSRAHAKEILSWVGLKEYFEVLPNVLSAGQKQRVAIARAVVTRPQLILADEPTGSVDDEIANKLMFLFETLNKTGTTVLIATHNQSLVNRFSHPVLQLHEGSLVSPYEMAA